MTGILLINKPKGITSQALLTKIKRKLNIKKIGHAGTLDPDATGLMVVMLNQATKLSDFLMSDDKEYIAEVVIGISTTTDDASGEVVEVKKVEKIDDIDQVLQSFLGKSMQTPPMYSAIKVEGRKLYQYAREGLEIARKAREIEIYKLEKIGEETYLNDTLSFQFKTKVSKGTYIRTLCYDIGKKLNYPAHMKNLIRTGVGKFRLSDAFDLDEVDINNLKLIPMHEAIDNIVSIEVDDSLARDILNGQHLDEKRVNSSEDLVGFIYKNNLIGIYKKNSRKYKPERIWN